MNKNLFSFFFSLCSLCVIEVNAFKPQAGTPVWAIAAEDIRLLCTVESKVCALQDVISDDFAGSFTVAETILDKVCAIESKAQLLCSDLEALQTNFGFDFSKLCAIESKLDEIEQDLIIDVAGTFTALDDLKEVVCSKLEQLNLELDNVQSNVDIVTQSEIEHTQTILSKLSVLEGGVVTLNSVLDHLTLDPSVSNVMCSQLELINSCLLGVDSKVDMLNSDLNYGFAGTFTALDTNLQKACAIESLTDEISMSIMVDLTGVFTSLGALENKICTIESLVDDMAEPDVTTILSKLCVLDSDIDVTSSKLCVLESKTDAAECDDCFSLLDSATQTLAVDCSIIDALNNNQMLEKACDIESNLDITISTLDGIQSQFEGIDSTVEVIESKICAVQMNSDALSKLCVVDSKVDVNQQTTQTIESLVDEIDMDAQAIASKVCGLSSLAIDSKLDVITPVTQTICSKLDELVPVLQTSESKLDVIIPVVASNNENLLTIESRVDALEVGVSISELIESKLCLIEPLVCTVESNLDVANSIIDVLGNKAMGLEADFAFTWTILDAIEQKVCTNESLLETISSKLDSLIDNPIDLSSDLVGVYTVIAAIEQKACTVDSKVDAIVVPQDVDFTGIFTTSDVILSKVCLMDDLVQTISTGIQDVSDCLGTPIFNVDVGTSGYTISVPGRYYLAENIVYAPAGTGTQAIEISTDDVTLDLNEHSITQTGGQLGTASTSGIVASTAVNNICIMNGAIRDLTSEGITFDSDSSNIYISNVSIHAVGLAGLDSGIDFTAGGNNIVITNCYLEKCYDTGIFLNGVSDASPMRNVQVKNCIIGDGVATESNGIVFIAVQNSLVKNCESFNNNRGISIVGNAPAFIGNFVINECIVYDNNIEAFQAYNVDRGSILNCNSIGNRALLSSGVTLARNAGEASDCVEIMHNSHAQHNWGVRLFDSTNSYVGFNTCTSDVNNLTTANFDERGTSGANTYLGNFAFNSNAEGDPNNSNYRIDGSSDITDKFVTLNQTAAFPSTDPTEWHNINMLR